MPQRSNAFQQVVRLLHEQLADTATVTESKLLIDRRMGEAHEVDIVVETTPAGYAVTIGVECVDRVRKVDVEWVDQMRGKHEDLPTDRVILVSSSGFTPRALAKAEALGFVALSLEEAKGEDWTLIVGKLARVFVDVVESQLDVSVVVRGDDGDDQLVPVERDLELRSVSGGALAPVGAVVDVLVAMPEVGRVLMEHMHEKDLSHNVFTAEYTFPETVVANDSAGTPREVKALRIALDSTRAQTAIDLKHGQLRGAGVAFGEGAGEAGSLRIAVIEREGAVPTIELLKRKGSVWSRVTNVDAS